jgi:hypothetical protein
MAPTNLWVIFGMKRYEQALHNRLQTGDELKVRITTHTPKKRLPRHKDVVVRLESYSRDGILVRLSTGEKKFLGWDTALEFCRREEVAVATT